MAYSNAFFAFAARKNILVRNGMTPLTFWLSNRLDDVYPSDEVVATLLEEANKPDVRIKELHTEEMDIKEIRETDIRSSLSRLFPGKEVKQGNTTQVDYVLQKYPPVLETSNIERSFESLWYITDPIVFNGNMCVNSLTNFSANRPGGFQWANARQDFSEELKSMNQFVLCGGTWEGMINVIRKGKTDTALDAGDLMMYLPRLKTKLPLLDPKEVRNMFGPVNFATTSFLGLMALIDLNYKARAGLPFPPLDLVDAEKVGKASKDAKVMWDLCGQFDLDDLVEGLTTNYAYLLAARLANKTAVYKWADLLEKTRPYFIYPLAFRIFSQAIYQSLKDRAGFWHGRPESINMLGFSWFHGGAGKLIEHLRSFPEGKLCVLCYSDDALLAVRKGNFVKMVSPDFSHMDGSIRQAHVDVNTAFDEYRVTRMGGNEQHRRAVQLSNFLAMNHAVIVTKNIAMFKTFGNSSGHPNTTGLNQTVAGICACVWEDVWEAGEYTFATFEDFVQAMAPEILSQVGLVVKPSTLDPVVANLDVPVEVSVPIRFLGQDLKKMTCKGVEVWVPYPPIENLLKSYIFSPGSYDKEVDPYEYRAGRAAGILICGGFAYPKFYEMLANDYKACMVQRKNDTTQSAENKQKGFDILKLPALYDEPFHPLSIEILQRWDWSSRLPPVDWVVSLFAPEGAIKYDLPVVGALGPVNQKRSLKELFKGVGKGTVKSGTVRSESQQAKLDLDEKNNRFLEAFKAAADKVVDFALAPPPSLVPPPSKPTANSKPELNVSDVDPQTGKKFVNLSQALKAAKKNQRSERQKIAEAEAQAIAQARSSDTSVEKLKYDLLNTLPRSRVGMMDFTRESKNHKAAFESLRSNKKIIMHKDQWVRKQEVSKPPEETKTPPPQNPVGQPPTVAPPTIFAKPFEKNKPQFNSKEDAVDDFIDMLIIAPRENVEVQKRYGAFFPYVRTTAPKLGAFYNKGTKIWTVEV